MRYAALLARLLYDPAGAITALRASRPVGAAFLAAVPMTLAYELLLTEFARDVRAILSIGAFDEGAVAILGNYAHQLPRLLLPLVFIVAVYVPSALFVLGVLVRGSGPVETIRRDYVASLAAALSIWAVTLAVWLVPAVAFVDPSRAQSRLLWTLLPSAFFLVPMVVNFARVHEAGYGRAVVAAVLGGCSLLLLPLAMWATFLLTSPIVLILTFFVLRGVFKEWSAARAARERLRQSLEMATLNPADASAHVNLGLIYEEQGDADRAAEHYRRALEIDPGEPDARYQLGRIARERGQLAAAISHFDAVVQLDSAHRNSEVWREIGATYFAAAQYEDARAAFEHFVSRRPSDAEGLFKLGLTLQALGRAEEARACMQAVVDAVRTAPIYQYRLERRWLTEAESFLRER
jgi:tetratricopeptide (TPR) repeat protein